MDGTLVDTEPYWMETEVALADAHGGTWTHEQAMQMVGNDLLTSGRLMRDQVPLPYDAAEIVEMLLDGVVARVRDAVPWCSGARELLLALKDEGVPCGLVTMSYQRFVEPILEQLPPGTFDAVITGDQVTNGKPHPEPYLTGAAALGVRPQDCLAIEDSPTGAASAHAAGCQVLVVPNHVPVPLRPDWLERRSLADLTVSQLKTLRDRDKTTPDLL
jgi:HAD superfamily hydrolase (TIGR01509 family)